VSNDALTIGTLRNIGDHPIHPATGRSRDLGGYRRHVRRNIKRDHVGARARKRLCECTTQTARRTADNSRLSIKP
jgi:hypothetical protein